MRYSYSYSYSAHAVLVLVLVLVLSACGIRTRLLWNCSTSTGLRPEQEHAHENKAADERIGKRLFHNTSNCGGALAGDDFPSSVVLHFTPPGATGRTAHPRASQHGNHFVRRSGAFEAARSAAIGKASFTLSCQSPQTSPRLSLKRTSSQFADRHKTEGFGCPPTTT